MTDPEEFQPSGLPDDPSTVEADDADVQEQVTELPDAPGADVDPALNANVAQGTSGPAPDGPR